MNRILLYLKRLGFSNIEARIYLTLLKTGTVTVRELSEKLNMNRTAIYPYIDALAEKGVVLEVKKGSRTHLQAIEPEQLYYLIDNQRARLKSLDSQFPTMVQLINTSFIKTITKEKGDIKYYKGRNNLKAIYKDSFQASEIRSYVKILPPNDPKKFFEDNLATYTEAFKQNPKMIMKEIFYETPITYTSAKTLAKNKRFFYKHMPRDIHLTTQDILIYDGTVAIINYEDDIDAIVLHNEYFYNNSKELFDFIWQMLPEPQD